MKASKFSDAQKAFIIKQGEDGTAVAEICRKAGISPATYFKTSSSALPLRPCFAALSGALRSHCRPDQRPLSGGRSQGAHIVRLF